MKNNMRYVWLTAENSGDRDGFNIYLSISGQREFLMHHRHNALLYRLLERGMRTDGLRRRTRRRLSVRMDGMVHHLLTVLDDYMLEREYERAVARQPSIAVEGFANQRRCAA